MRSGADFYHHRVQVGVVALMHNEPLDSVVADNELTSRRISNNYHTVDHLACGSDFDRDFTSNFLAFSLQLSKTFSIQSKIISSETVN
jgi:hypothetical protein